MNEENEDLYNELFALFVVLDNEKIIKVEAWNKLHFEVKKFVKEIERINDKIEEVWCVSTKNGTIITRENDCIFISGNCEAMFLMLQQDKPDDYVIATNESHSVKEFIEECCRQLDLTCYFCDIDELSNDILICEEYDQKGKKLGHIKINKTEKRPWDVDYLRGDYSKAKRELGWQPEIKFKELIKIMIKEEVKRYEKTNYKKIK